MIASIADLFWLMSLVKLRQGNLLETVDEILVKTQLKPEFLDLELTETELLDENLLPIMREITKRGVSLSIDDFGTGYSSLSYLKQLPVDNLKIDQSFIRNVNSDPEYAAITKAIIQMAHSLKLKVIAEGVEVRAELDFLRREQCDEMQGYLFSRPLPAAEFEKLLTTYQTSNSL